MTAINKLILILFLLITSTVNAQWFLKGGPDAHLEYINLNDTTYVAKNDTLYIRWNNLNPLDTTSYNYRVTCTVGQTLADGFRYAPTTTGSYAFTLKIYKQLVWCKTITSTIVVVDDGAGTGTPKTVFIGNSLTAGVNGSGTTIGSIVKARITGMTIDLKGSQTGNNEGHSGWTTWDYTTVGRTSYIFTVSGVSVNPVIGSVYTNNGTYFTVIYTPSISGTGTMICENTSSGSPPLASGTLTKFSGTGDATITYSSNTTGSLNPFWSSGALDMSNYVSTYSLGGMDIAVIMLGINDLIRNTSYRLTTTGVSTLPTVGSYYAWGGNQHTVRDAGSGYVVLESYFTYPYQNYAGQITKIEGTGDNTISYNYYDISCQGQIAGLKKLVDAILAYNANCKIVICAEPMGTRDMNAYGANYTNLHAYPYFYAMTVLSNDIINAFGRTTYSNKVKVAMPNLTIDIRTGYASDNAVHPTPEGYRQIGSQVRAAILSFY